MNYVYVGECVRDLLLIAHNCRLFNQQQSELVQAAKQYESQLLVLVNQFLRGFELN